MTAASHPLDTTVPAGVLPPADGALSLRETQQLLASVIMNPLSSARRGARGERMKPLTANGAATRDIANRLVKPNDRLTSTERLEIYNRQDRFRLIDCFYDDFPGVRAILGENRFYDLTIAYLAKYPSRSFSLRNLGCELPRFLEEEPQWAGRRLRATREMAAFEWAQIVAFDGPARRPIAPDTLAQSDPAELRLHLQPYITLLELHYPFDDMIIALRKGDAVRSEASVERSRAADDGSRLALPKPRAIHLAVHRFDNALYYKRLDPAAFGPLLRALSDGEKLAAACARAAQVFRRTEKLPETLRGWFAVWTSLGWFAQPADILPIDEAPHGGSHAHRHDQV